MKIKTSLLFLGIGAIIGLLILAGFTFWQRRQIAPQAQNRPPPSSPDPTSTWKTYHNEKYRFEVKYPSDWFVEESSSDLSKDDIALLRTKNYREETLSECCPFGIQAPGDENKIVRIYDGEITISFYPESFVDQECPIETTKRVPGRFYSRQGVILQLPPGPWRACVKRPEGFSIPHLYLKSLVPGYYLSFSGGLEDEKYEADVNEVSDYNFLILDIIKTFRFTQ